jgi:hypothetical protein
MVLTCGRIDHGSVARPGARRERAPAAEVHADASPAISPQYVNDEAICQLLALSVNACATAAGCSIMRNTRSLYYRLSRSATSNKSRTRPRCRRQSDKFGRNLTEVNKAASGPWRFICVRKRDRSIVGTRGARTLGLLSAKASRGGGEAGAEPAAPCRLRAPARLLASRPRVN